MKKKSAVSEEEIQQALAKFLRRGGLINQLPDQFVPRNLMVGGKWGMYEPVMEGAGASSASSK